MRLPVYPWLLYMTAFSSQMSPSGSSPHSSVERPAMVFHSQSQQSPKSFEPSRTCRPHQLIRRSLRPSRPSLPLLSLSSSWLFLQSAKYVPIPECVRYLPVSFTFNIFLPDILMVRSSFLQSSTPRAHGEPSLHTSFKTKSCAS